MTYYKKIKNKVTVLAAWDNRPCIGASGARQPVDITGRQDRTKHTRDTHKDRESNAININNNWDLLCYWGSLQ